MSGGSSSGDEWSSRLEPVRPDAAPRRPDDSCLAEIVEFWQGGVPAFAPGRAVLIGYPEDEGVRRNYGRPGAAEAPREMRRWLHRLPPWDCETDTDLARHPPLDLGNVRSAGGLEETQDALGAVVAAVLEAGAVPVVLGGGHETAFGHYLGYVRAGVPVGIVNLDAHLDVRPCLEDGRGHSGSPFRQALEHPTHPLPGNRYVCLGAQPHAISRQHFQYARDRGCVIRWCDEVRLWPRTYFHADLQRLAEAGCQVYVSVDADVVQAADVPGVSAPNPTGLWGQLITDCARLAGRSSQVSSFDLVEINPRFDVDGRSARWAALAVWHFLMGLAERAARP